MAHFTSHSEQETLEIAKNVAFRLRGGEVVLLEGALGTGKTVFVKGLAAGIGIKDTIQSPTFVLMKVYERVLTQSRGIKYLVHIDTYRIQNAHQLISIGVLDYIGKPDTVVAIEWPEKMVHLLVEDIKTIKVILNHGKQKGDRQLEIL